MKRGKPRFITREKAFAKLKEDRGARMRNYELEGDLGAAFGGEWVIAEWCPSNGVYCHWADYASKKYLLDSLRVQAALLRTIEPSRKADVEASLFGLTQLLDTRFGPVPVPPPPATSPIDPEATRKAMTKALDEAFEGRN